MKKLLIILIYLLTSSISLAASCDINKGIKLLSQENPSVTSVQAIINACDQAGVNNYKILLLKGLLARQQANQTGDYKQAIDILKKAQEITAVTDFSVLLELGITYEWAQQFEQAKAVYQQVLNKSGQSRPALLGLARVAIAQNNKQEAIRIYQQLLKNNPIDNEAQIGLQQAQDVDEDLINFKLQPYCQANQGFRLLNISNPPLATVEAILARCDKQMPNNSRVILLHGLFEREKAKHTHHYLPAITWLEKAVKKADFGDINPKLELAVTYEWDNQRQKAKDIYDALLKKKPTLKPALLGLARIAAIEGDYDYAKRVYQYYLNRNENDVDAINGMARISMMQKNYVDAKLNFEKVLSIKPNNQDAAIGLEQIKQAQMAVSKKTELAVKKIIAPTCEYNQGLNLINQAKPPYEKIKTILKKCDKNIPNDVQVLLLHGLLARKQGNYTQAIAWFQQAQKQADANNLAPSLELAVTYEWSAKMNQAKNIYDSILAQNPNNKAALLGRARIYRAQYEIAEARCIYNRLLKQNPNDTDALTGLAWVKLTNKELSGAKKDFNQVLQKRPHDADTLLGLNMLQEVTPYLLSINAGQYTVSNLKSFTGNINFYADLNATDQFILQATHNSNEIQLSLVLDPTVLPKNSLFLGFQRQYFNRYGWGINYEYRERTQFRVEHRIGMNGNYYLLNNLQIFGGARQGFPSPWNNKLFYSGLILFTDWPINPSITGYWGRQQFGGSTSSYSFDLSKEFPNHAYYDLGTSYSPSQLSWEVHGRFVLPMFKNQGLEGAYEHLYFNGSTAYSLGWRIYWA